MQRKINKCILLKKHKLNMIFKNNQLILILKKQRQAHMVQNQKQLLGLFLPSTLVDLHQTVFFWLIFVFLPGIFIFFSEKFSLQITRVNPLLIGLYQKRKDKVFRKHCLEMLWTKTPILLLILLTFGLLYLIKFTDEPELPKTKIDFFEISWDLWQDLENNSQRYAIIWEGKEKTIATVYIVTPTMTINILPITYPQINDDEIFLENLQTYIRVFPPRSLKSMVDLQPRVFIKLIDKQPLLHPEDFFIDYEYLENQYYESLSWPEQIKYEIVQCYEQLCKALAVPNKNAKPFSNFTQNDSLKLPKLISDHTYRKTLIALAEKAVANARLNGTFDKLLSNVPEKYKGLYLQVNFEYDFFKSEPYFNPFV